MSHNKDQNLNSEEKNEIKSDVKDAMGKAFKKPINNIDKILKEGPKATLNQEEIDKIVNKKNKNTDKKPIIITLILTLLIAIAGIYMYFSNNPKTIFIKAIDKTFITLEKNTKPQYEKTKGELTINLDANQDKEKVNIFKIDMDYGIDTKNNLFNADMKLTSENNELLGMTIYSESNKTYLYSENILNKFIELDINLGNKDETKIILNSLNKAIRKSIENEKFTGSKTQIDVNGKMTKTYKSSFTLDQNNIETVLNNIKDTLNQDEKYIDAISKLESKTKEEAKQEITNKINEAKNNLANTESITFNIFTKGAAWEFVKLEISEIINNETNIYSITNIDDNNYQYAISNKQTNQNITGNIEYKTEKNNLYLKLDMNTEKKQSLTLTLNNKYQKAKKIELIDTNNVVKLSELSDEEKLNIISKIIFAN